MHIIINRSPTVQQAKTKKALPNLGKLVMSFVGSVSQLISNTVLVWIYLILMLMERKHFKKFILNLVRSDKKGDANRAIAECVSTSSRYLFGRLIIMTILVFVTGGITSLLIVVVVIIIGQLVDNYVLTPWIVGSAVRLSPFVTIVSIVAFTLVWGPIGAIIALPLTGMLRILLHSMETTRVYAEFLADKKSRD